MSNLRDKSVGAGTSRRYRVTELEGFIEPVTWRTNGSNAKQGLSVQIIDTAVLHRCVWQRRSEDYGKNTATTLDWIRYEAERRCRQLNGDDPPPSFHRWRSQFRPTCPSCGNRCTPDAAYCSCGCPLYKQEIGFNVRAARYGQ